MRNNANLEYQSIYRTLNKQQTVQHLSIVKTIFVIIIFNHYISSFVDTWWTMVNLLRVEGFHRVALSFIQKSWQVMHSYMYNDLTKSLPVSSWLALLVLAVVTERSLPGFQLLKFRSFNLIQIHKEIWHAFEAENFILQRKPQKILVLIKDTGLDITIRTWSCRDISQVLWKGGSFRYIGTTLTNQNFLQEEIRNRLKPGNACCHSVQNFYFQFAPKNIKINIYWNMISPAALCGYETVSLTLREKRWVMGFENLVLRCICGSKREEVWGERRKLHNEELNDLYCSPNIIWVI